MVAYFFGGHLVYIISVCFSFISTVRTVLRHVLVLLLSATPNMDDKDSIHGPVAFNYRNFD